MAPKDLKIDQKESISLKEAVKATKIESMIVAPNQRPIIKVYPPSTSSDDILAGTFRGLEDLGFRTDELKLKGIKYLKKGIEDTKDGDPVYKFSANVSLEGVGGSFDKSRSRETQRHTEESVEIIFEAKED